MQNNFIDLDQIAPEPRTVKVNNKVYEIKPLRLTDFLSLQKILKKFANKPSEEMVEYLDQIFESLRPIVPDIDDMNLTMTQAMALLQFIYQQEEQSKTAEKKTAE